LYAVRFLYSDAQRAQSRYSCGVGEALVSGVGLGVQSLQSTRIQSTVPTRLGLFTLVVAGCFFSLLNYFFLKQADEAQPIIFTRLLVVRLLYQFGFRGI
jgi:hypothetical protein